MGSEVIVIEFSDNVPGKIDADIRDAAVRHARGLGIKIHTETSVSSVLKDKNGFEVKATHSKDTLTIQAETILLAAGRVPAVDDIGMGNAGVEFDRGGINVDYVFTYKSAAHMGHR